MVKITITKDGQKVEEFTTHHAVVGVVAGEDHEIKVWMTGNIDVLGEILGDSVSHYVQKSSERIRELGATLGQQINQQQMNSIVARKRLLGS